MKRFQQGLVLAAWLLAGGLMTGCSKSDSGNDNNNGNGGPGGGNSITYKNKIAFLYKRDSTDGAAFRSLLQANNCGVTLVDSAQTGSTDFTKFDLVVVGNNTAGSAGELTPQIVGAVKTSGKPVLLIGEGGGHFGEQLNTAVNWGSCAVFPLPASMIVLDSSTTLYKSPKKIIIPDNQQLPIFSQAQSGIAFYRSPYTSYPSVQMIAQASTSNVAYLSITLESGKYGFFGYYGNVSGMTSTGRDFMVNLCYYVGKLAL